MIAQTLVEYGALHSISAAFGNAINRLEYYIGSGNAKYLLALVIVVAVFLIVPRRRAR
jgi:hypothetical protein